MSNFMNWSLDDILDLIQAMNTFDVNDYVISTKDGKAQVDIKCLFENGQALPVVSFVTDNELRLLRIEFNNGQSVVLNRDEGRYEVAGKKGGSGFVYIISNGNGLFKIGYSTDPEKRLRSLQTSTPYTLELLHSWYHPRAFEMEIQLHKDYKHCRVRAEWFNLTNDDIRDIDQRFSNDR